MTNLSVMTWLPPSPPPPQVWFHLLSVLWCAWRRRTLSLSFIVHLSFGVWLKELLLKPLSDQIEVWSVLTCLTQSLYLPKYVTSYTAHLPAVNQKLICIFFGEKQHSHFHRRVHVNMCSHGNAYIRIYSRNNIFLDTLLVWCFPPEQDV